MLIWQQIKKIDREHTSCQELNRDLTIINNLLKTTN